MEKYEKFKQEVRELIRRLDGKVILSEYTNGNNTVCDDYASLHDIKYKETKGFFRITIDYRNSYIWGGLILKENYTILVTHLNQNGLMTLKMKKKECRSIQKVYKVLRKKVDLYKKKLMLEK